VPFPKGTLSRRFLLSVVHIKCAPVYRHKAGSIRLVPELQLASPQVVSILCLMDPAIRWLYFACFLVADDNISASIIIVWSGGSISSGVLNDGQVFCTWSRKFPAVMA